VSNYRYRVWSRSGIIPTLVYPIDALCDGGIMSKIFCSERSAIRLSEVQSIHLDEYDKIRPWIVIFKNSKTLTVGSDFGLALFRAFVGAE